MFDKSSVFIKYTCILSISSLTRSNNNSGQWSLFSFQFS